MALMGSRALQFSPFAVLRAARSIRRDKVEDGWLRTLLGALEGRAKLLVALDGAGVKPVFIADGEPNEVTVEWKGYLVTVVYGSPLCSFEFSQDITPRENEIGAYIRARPSSSRRFGSRVEEVPRPRPGVIMKLESDNVAPSDVLKVLSAAIERYKKLSARKN